MPQGRQEALAVPGGLCRDVFSLGIHARLHRSFAIPDDLTFQRELGEGLHPLIAADVEKLLAALAADFDPVPPSLKLTAKGPHKRPLGIEDEDRRMILELLAALVDHVEVTGGVEGHVVGRLPGEAVGQLRKMMLHAEGVLAFADDRFTGQPTNPRRRWPRGQASGRRRNRHARHKRPP